MSELADIPPPRFERDALLTCLRLNGNPAAAVRTGLPAIPPPVWQQGADALSNLFGLDRPNHCFAAAPHPWARFHEPQITGGFAHFINTRAPRQRLARAVAFVKAAAACAGKDVAAIDAFGPIAAYCVAEENRTDILIELRRGEDRLGAVLEAKFGHRLTQGQLPKALKHARDIRALSMDQSVLLVVAPDVTVLDGRVLRQNHRYGWRATSWWALLDQLERFTAPADDCCDYRRFRRTVWHRAS